MAKAKMKFDMLIMDEWKIKRKRTKKTPKTGGLNAEMDTGET